MRDRKFVRRVGRTKHPMGQFVKDDWRPIGSQEDCSIVVEKGITPACGAIMMHLRTEERPDILLKGLKRHHIGIMALTDLQHLWESSSHFGEKALLILLHRCLREITKA